MENLVFLFLYLSQKNENKHQEFKFPPSCRVTVSLGNNWQTKSLARGLSMRSHFAAVSVGVSRSVLCLCMRKREEFSRLSRLRSCSL